MPNLSFKQLRLHHNFIFGMHYWEKNQFLPVLGSQEFFKSIHWDLNKFSIQLNRKSFRDQGMGPWNFHIALCIQVALLKTFLTQFELCFYFKYLRSYKGRRVWKQTQDCQTIKSRRIYFLLQSWKGQGIPCEVSDSSRSSMSQRKVKDFPSEVPKMQFDIAVLRTFRLKKMPLVPFQHCKGLSGLFSRSSWYSPNVSIPFTYGALFISS